jgi:hypothetical protein
MDNDWVILLIDTYKVKTKLTLRFTEHQTIETCGVVEVWFHTFVTSALEDV